MYPSRLSVSLYAAKYLSVVLSSTSLTDVLDNTTLKYLAAYKETDNLDGYMFYI